MDVYDRCNSRTGSMAVFDERYGFMPFILVKFIH